MVDNDLLFSYQREINRLRTLPPTKENLEMIGLVSGIHSALTEIHKLDIEQRTIEDAQTKLISDTAKFINKSNKVNEQIQRAYEEIMKMYIRRQNEPN